MSGRWFRVYDGLLDDPKVQRLPAELFRYLVNLWCLASRHNGELPELNDIGFALRISPDQAAQLLSQLGEAGLIDEGENGPIPHNWNARQFKSDVSTERVRQFRKRHETVSGTANETPPDTEQIQNRTDQKERERGASAPSSKRGSQVPEDWQPKPETIDALLTKKGFQREFINSELEKFRDYHKAKGTVFRDFEAAFRTWMRNAREFAATRGGARPANGKAHVVSGSWKPFAPIKGDPPKPPPEDRERQVVSRLKDRLIQG